MLISHLPAGYILSKAVLTAGRNAECRLCLWTGLLASILPDLDMLYFHLIDKKQHLHHSLWPHIPAFWLSMLPIVAFSWILIRNKRYRLGSIVFFLNIILHLFMDTINGGIAWAYPFSKHLIVFFEIPPRFNWWVYSFMAHWTFGIEILVLIAAAAVFLKAGKGLLAKGRLGRIPAMENEPG